MFDKIVADVAACARNEVDHAFWHARLFQHFQELVRHNRSTGRRLEQHCVTCYECSSRRARHDGESEVPRGDDESDTERYVVELVVFTQTRSNETPGSALMVVPSVIALEFEAFRVIRIRFLTRLAGFLDKDVCKIQQALTDEARRFEPHIGP